MKESEARKMLKEANVPLKTIDKFIAYHKANPSIWKEFEKKVFEYIKAGVKRVSGKKAVEDIRYEYQLRFGDKDKYKVSNSYTAYYTRIFVFEHPQYKDRFKFNCIKGLRAEPEFRQTQLFS